MADNDNEVVPSGWEKRLSRSTGKLLIDIYKIHENKIIHHNFPVSWAFRNALLLEFAHQRVAVGLSVRTGRGSVRNRGIPLGCYFMFTYCKNVFFLLFKEVAQLQCSHLLVKHNGSRRASSWREDVITRSKAEAREILEKYLEQIQSGERTLEELAQKYSDCSSAKRGGDLGPFKRGIERSANNNTPVFINLIHSIFIGEMQAPFEDASFKLAIGQLSGIVETNSGLHIIKRTR